MNIFVRVSDHKSLKFHGLESVVRPDGCNNAVLCSAYLVVSLMPFHVKLAKVDDHV
jgi:hypothetical protein